jgi:hypothetical protein
MSNMGSYYYPLSTREYTFENIFSSESVSPQAVYPVRRFGFDYFHLVDTLQTEKAIILFSSPPKYELQSGAKFILEVEESALDLNCLIFLAEGIYAYQKTIYFTRDTLKVIFFSEKDMKVCILRSESSLPTKCTNKYKHNFRVIDDMNTRVFEPKLEVKTILQEDLNQVAELDKRFNHFKGFIYGLIIGMLEDGSRIDVHLKRQLQEITNSFAELKSRLEDPKNKQTHFYIEKLFQNLEKGNELYNLLELDREISDDLLLDYLLNNQSRLRSRDDVKMYLDYLIVSDELFETSHFGKLKEQYSKQTRSKTRYFDTLKNSALEFINQVQHSRRRLSDAEYINDQFKITISKIRNDIETHFDVKSVDNPIDLEYFNFDLQANTAHIDSNFKHLDLSKDEDFLLIINAILKFSKSGRGPAKKDTMLQIVEHIGNKFVDRGKDTLLYQYLDNKIDAYSIEKASSIVMKNFVAFIFNPDSLEKLDNFLVSKDVEKKWMAYAFWCTFNGFANISRNYTKAIFNDSNINLQIDLDNYFSDYLRTARLETTENTIVFESYLEDKNEQNINLQKPSVEDFYSRFVNKSYNLTIEQLREALKIDDQLFFVTELKKKYSITKKDGNKLFISLKKYFDPASLFS